MGPHVVAQLRRRRSRVHYALRFGLPLAGLVWATAAGGQTPIAGHYPPGQSGIRGAATPPVGWAYTNFSRLFSNLEVKDSSGRTTEEVEEARYANITMITWVSDRKVLGMQYGALAGIPFATGNLTPSADDLGSTGFGLGDILLTPVALYGRKPAHDYQLQLTVWSASGRFTAGSADNRGSGFWALVYSLGGVWYPGGDRSDWSLSAVARLEQNFEQTGSGIDPGDDVVVDWGIGKVVRGGRRSLELGISGYAAWQLTEQSGGAPAADLDRYRYFGGGPEGSFSPGEHWTLRLRAHWEFLARNAVKGNSLWLIVNYAS